MPNLSLVVFEADVIIILCLVSHVSLVAMAFIVSCGLILSMYPSIQMNKSLFDVRSSAEGCINDVSLLQLRDI